MLQMISWELVPQISSQQFQHLQHKAYSAQYVDALWGILAWLQVTLEHNLYHNPQEMEQ